ncbi:MAG TPA: hypothetical protein VHK27_03750 [Gammaproteobacteria bacterium]|nr:hypothetical protein [Gammaproteobacteria bacterium]
MTKQTAVARKRPVSLEKADDFINRKVPKVPKTADEPIIRMTVHLPDSIHRRLKAKAAMEGVKIKQIIVAAAAAYLDGKITVTKAH